MIQSHSTWKKLLSYFFERTIEQRSSPHNQLLEVRYANGTYLLHAADVNYSFGSLHTIFQKAFHKMNLAGRPILDVLLLGLGGGSVPALLAGHGKQYRITAVEIDQEVIRLGKKYFFTDRLPEMEIICADAKDYVAGCNGSYDLVIMDVFQNDVIPQALQTDTFLRQLQTLVRPHGLLLYNRLNFTRKHAEESHAFYIHFQKIMQGTTHARRIDGNLMLSWEKPA